MKTAKQTTEDHEQAINALEDYVKRGADLAVEALKAGNIPNAQQAITDLIGYAQSALDNIQE